MNLSRALRALLLTGFLTWVATGSEASVNHWTPAGPTSPTVTALAFDPFVPGRILAGTEGEGIYVTVDGGTRWTAASISGPVPLQVLTLLAHPELRVMIAGTTRGFYLSRDGGRSWFPLGGSLDGITDIVVDPDDVHRLYAASYFGGVYRSTDGGETWTATGRPRSTVDDLAVGGGVLYASSTAGIHRSTDLGETWEEVAAYAVTDLAYDAPTDTVYAATFEQGFFLSRDGGDSWIQRGLALPRSPAYSIALAPGEGHRADTGSAPPTLYLGTLEGVWTTHDDGVSWSRLPVEGDLGDRVLDVRVDPHAPWRIYWGTALDGVWASDDEPGSWSPRNTGFRGRPALLDVAADPTSSSTVYLAAESGRLFRSGDAGKTWTALVLPTRNHVFGLVVDPTTPSTLYAVAGSVWRSPDRGRTWIDTRLGGRSFAVFGLAPDPSSPRSLYAGTAVGVWKTSNGGVTWTPAIEGLDSANERGDAGVYAVVVHPETPSTLFAGTATGLFVSTDSAATWSRLGSGFPSPPWIRALVLDPRHPQVLYAAVTFSDSSSGVWKSTDAGASWSTTGLDVAAHHLAAVPHPGPAASTVYASSVEGVFVSYDSGGRWSRFGAGLGPVKQVKAIAVDPESRSALYAATNEGLVTTRGVAPTPVLKLQDGRFRVEVDWRDFADRTGRGRVAVVPSPRDDAVALSSRDSAVLRFFSPENWEVLVKVLDGRAVNGHFWVFSAAATNVGYFLNVSDTRCHESRSFHHRGGDAAFPVLDTLAFPQCSDPGPPVCLPGPETLCLGEDGRFRVEVLWVDPLSEALTSGRQVLLSEPGRARSHDSGLFYFFTEDNWELLVKVLDGCALNGHYWVFGAAATNVEYTITVTDTVTGSVKAYTNPLGVASEALTDTLAFATCK